jgi:hypothetical protein
MNSAEQKFCRSCGLSFDKIVQSLTEQLPPGQVNKKLEERQRTVERLLTIAGVSAAAIFMAGILWKVVYKIILIKGNVIEGLGFLSFLLLVVAAGILALYRDSLLKANKRALPEATPALVADTGKLLSESRLEPIPSVTESTTELLPTEKTNSQ